MADIYDMLLTGDVQDPDRMAAMARRLRQREALGTLGALSGDPVLGPWGSGEVSQARERAGGLAQARRQARMDARPRPTGNPAFYFDEQGNPVMFPGYEAMQERAQERKMGLERAKAANRAAAAERKRIQGIEDQKAFETWKRTQPTPSQATSARETAGLLPEIGRLAMDLQTGDFDIPNIPETGAEFLRENVPGFGPALATSLERFGMERPAITWLTSGRQMEQEIIRMAAGLQMTQAEIAGIKKFSPWAVNLTKWQRLERLADVYNKLGRKAASIENKPWEDISFSQETQATDQPGAMDQPGTPVGAIDTDDEGNRYRFKGGDDTKAENWEKYP